MTEQDRQEYGREHWMRRALELARQSIGRAAPNPAVGCVLVKDGKIVGEGFHIYDQRDHAEVVALKMAGSNARGATAYVTLEPCSHTGRTGPCANALIDAGVARVVAATGDPNPTVNGCGVKRLREAGIRVDVGLLRDEARELNDGFARYICTRLPFVTLKAGVSLDGKIAPPPQTRASRAPVMLTGAESQAEVQRMRHASDALITGIGTALTDDPLLTDRSGQARRRPLLRVVLDSHLRLPTESKLAQSANGDLLVFCVDADSERRCALEDCGVLIEQMEGDAASGRVSLKNALKRLGEMEITSVMLEGGSHLNTSALAGFADKLSLFYAPLLLGAHAVPLFQSDAMRMNPIRTRNRSFGPDVLIESWLRDAWTGVKG